MSMSGIYEPSLAPEPVPPSGARPSPRRRSTPAGPATLQRLDVLLHPHDTPAKAAAQLRRRVAGCGFGVPAAWLLEQAPAAALPTDGAALAAFGGAIRLVGTVVRCGEHVRAWTGPAFVPRDHLLAGVADGHDAAVVRLVNGSEVLLAARPPSGLALAAALAAIAPGPPSGRDPHDPGPGAASAAAATPTWIVRMTFPHALPPPSFAAQLLREAGLPVDDVVAAADRPTVSSCWARLGVVARATVDRAGTDLRHRHRLHLEPFVALSTSCPDLRPVEPQPPRGRAVTRPTL